MKKIFSILLALAMPLYAMPIAAGAEEFKDTVDIKDAVSQASNGEVITIPADKSGLVGGTSDNDAEPWVIDKAVTIKGAVDGTPSVLNVRLGGMVLEADITLENLDIAFPNSIRRAIITNGHTLTLRNVKYDKASTGINLPLFCGELNGSTYSAAKGTEGKIIMQDCTGFGNIYAGNLSENGAESTSALPATVTIESGSAGTATGLYACGGTLSGPDSTQYKVTGDVIFNLYHTAISKVDGDMGGGKKAAVSYEGLADLNTGLQIQNAASLALYSPVNLQVASGSSLSGTALTVPAGATLNLANIGNQTLGGFSGGGTLVLGENQQLTINGVVSGVTKVGIKNVFNGESEGTVKAGDVLIHAPQSQSNSFSLVPLKAPYASLIIQRETNGDWQVADPNAGTEQKILVKSLAAGTPAVNPGKTEVQIPYTVTFGTGSAPVSQLPFVRLTVLGNNSSSTTSQQDENEYYYYTWNNSDGSFVLELDEDNFIFKMKGGTAIPDGTYNFNITVPKENSASGQAVTTKFTVTVGDAGNTDPPAPSKPTKIDVPTAKTGLKYTGQEQTGVEAGTGYTLSGQVNGTEIGEYTAWATLNADYLWNDGTSAAKEIKWSIGKGEAPAAPTGLKAVSPTKENGRDGKISGTTDKMEYASKSDFENAKPCTGDAITGLPAGTYYVRLKETDKYEPGAYAVVKVLAFGEVEEIPEPPVEVKVPISGEEKTVQVSASISGSTAVVSTIDTTQLGSVIGEKVDTGMVRIDFSGLEQAIDTVELPGSAIKEIAAASQAQGNDVEGLALKLSTGSVSFDDAALDAVQKQAGSKITLQILAKDRHDLTPAQLEAAGTAPAFDVSLQGSAAITDFGTGKATVSLPYALKPGQSAAGIVVYYWGEDNKISACPTQYSQVEKTAAFTTSHFSLYFIGFDPAIQWKNPFNDVRKGEWFYGAVEFAELNGLMQGDSKTVFAPNQKLSRAQLAQILYNKEGRPRVSGSGSFIDVPAQEWYADAVNWAAQKGYVNGYDSSHFGPNNPVTREQLAAILWRYAGEPKAKKAALSSFTDAGKTSEYALPALRWAVQNKIIQGKGNNRLDPTGTATRAEVAQMLMNYLA